MQERLVENWLTKVNEKSFQIPFCQMLTAEGYRVVHLTRHGPFEEGKDVLAISDEGIPCAFQLKGTISGKITQREWSKYVTQINRLVELRIKHPEIDPDSPRRVFFVTNGELEEEVRLEIVSRNEDWAKRGHPQLETIVKGDLLLRFMNLQDNLWPLNLTFEKELLEFFLADGHGYVDKQKYSKFLENLLIDPGLPKLEITKKIAITAIFASYALSPFDSLKNHVALIEGWTIFLSYIIGLTEKKRLSFRKWHDQADLILQAISNSLEDLSEELRSSKVFVTGNPLVDAPFFRARFTWLLCMLCIYIIRKKRIDQTWEPDDWMTQFLIQNQSQVELWGEAAIPQCLAIVWVFSMFGFRHLSDRLLFAITKGIVQVNDHRNGLVDPYHSLAEVIMINHGLGKEEPENNYKNRSYVLEGLIELFARRDWRGALAEMWKPITNIQYADFDPEKIFQYCLWISEEGRMNVTYPHSPQSWSDLQQKASIINTNKIPKYFLDNPDIFLLFLVVYPHRIDTNAMKYLDEKFYQI